MAGKLNLTKNRYAVIFCRIQSQKLAILISTSAELTVRFLRKLPVESDTSTYPYVALSTARFHQAAAK